MATPERILAAAVTEFARHGWAGTPVQAIATRAGVARGTVLWHFGSKTQLYAAAVESVGDGLLKALRGRADQDGASFEQIATTWLDHLAKYPDAARILRSLVRENARPDVDRTAQALNERFVAFWRDWLHRFEGPGGQRTRRTSRDQLARLIVATLSGLLTMALDGTVWHALPPLAEFSAVVEVVAFGDAHNGRAQGL